MRKIKASYHFPDNSLIKYTYHPWFEWTNHPPQPSKALSGLSELTIHHNPLKPWWLLSQFLIDFIMKLFFTFREPSPYYFRRTTSLRKECATYILCWPNEWSSSWTFCFYLINICLYVHGGMQIHMLMVTQVVKNLSKSIFYYVNECYI